MNTKKILTYYGIFGCWTKFIPGTVGTIMFGIWLAMILFWIAVNGGGVICYFLDKTKVKKEATLITPNETRIWHVYNYLALCNFAVAGEFTIAIAFALTSLLFMYITEKAIEDKKAKKK